MHYQFTELLLSITASMQMQTKIVSSLFSFDSSRYLKQHLKIYPLYNSLSTSIAA